MQNGTVEGTIAYAPLPHALRPVSWDIVHENSALVPDARFIAVHTSAGPLAVASPTDIRLTGPLLWSRLGTADTTTADALAILAEFAQQSRTRQKRQGAFFVLLALALAVAAFFGVPGTHDPGLPVVLASGILLAGLFVGITHAHLPPKTVTTPAHAVLPVHFVGAHRDDSGGWVAGGLGDGDGDGGDGGD